SISIHSQLHRRSSQLMKKFYVCLVAALAFVIAAKWIDAQGPLAPPAGAPAPTMKSLSEVEPRTAVQSLARNASYLYVVSQPGAYYLTGNIGGISGKGGIDVTTDSVTIDLNGFALIGVPSATTGIDTSPAGHSTVVNGSIHGWPNSGLYLGSYGV